MTDHVESPPADLLATIVAATKRIVEIRAAREPFSAIARRAEKGPATGGRFREALTRPDRIHVIAECKRRSPSRGVLRADYDPASIAAGYERAGAAAISVLTEPTFFDGSLSHLEAVRAAVRIPVLRKDFIVEEYQLFEAKAAGADAVLLIVAALEPAMLKDLLARAGALGLDTLVEVHAIDELSQALEAGARIVGVNNRNLRTLQVDVQASDVLIDRIPDDVVAVSESGLRVPADLIRLGARGYKAFLVGERLMAAADPALQLRELLDGCVASTSRANHGGSA